MKRPEQKVPKSCWWRKVPKQSLHSTYNLQVLIPWSSQACLFSVFFSSEKEKKTKTETPGAWIMGQNTHSHDTQQYMGTFCVMTYSIKLPQKRVWGINSFGDSKFIFGHDVFLPSAFVWPSIFALASRETFPNIKSCAKKTLKQKLPRFDRGLPEGHKFLVLRQPCL